MRNFLDFEKPIAELDSRVAITLVLNAGAFAAGRLARRTAG